MDKETCIKELAVIFLEEKDYDAATLLLSLLANSKTQKKVCESFMAPDSCEYKEDFDSKAGYIYSSLKHYGAAPATAVVMLTDEINKLRRMLGFKEVKLAL